MLYEHGRKRATSVAFTLGLVALLTGAARADVTAPVAPASPTGTAATVLFTAHPAPVDTTRQPLRISLFEDGIASASATRAETVGAFLVERGVTTTRDDAVSPPLSTPLRADTNVVVRHARPVTIVDGRTRTHLLSSAPTVGDLLAATSVTLGANDRVSPSADTVVTPDLVVAVRRAQPFETTRSEAIPAPTRVRFSSALPAGTVRVERRGSPGRRLVESRFERHDGIATRVATTSRVVLAPQTRVVVHGTARLAALARIARTGFDATVRFAGQAISMMATAYTAACYGCSGMTASGVHAGRGVVAVDPSVIPLGTRLFIPGYGHAVAGDTGGAIVGHRIDLGMDRLRDALQFGRKSITVYIEK